MNWIKWHNLGDKLDKNSSWKAQNWSIYEDWMHTKHRGWEKPCTWKQVQVAHLCCDLSSLFIFSVRTSTRVETCLSTNQSVEWNYPKKATADAFVSRIGWAGQTVVHCSCTLHLHPYIHISYVPELVNCSSMPCHAATSNRLIVCTVPCVPVTTHKISFFFFFANF